MRVQQNAATPVWDGGKYISSRGTSHLQLCQIIVKEYGSRNPSIN